MTTTSAGMKIDVISSAGDLSVPSERFVSTRENSRNRRQIAAGDLCRQAGGTTSVAAPDSACTRHRA